MKKNTIYKITVLKWEKHNPNRKKSYKYTLIANNFCSDSKLEALPMSIRWMYLGLLLLCGDHGEACVKVNRRTLVALLKTGGSIEEALARLESLQLVTCEVLKFPLILNELNRIEGKGIEENCNEVEKDPDQPQKKRKQISNNDRDENRLIWKAYFNAYRIRYSVEPIKNVTVNSQVAQLRSRLGIEEAIKVVEFYLTHNDSFFLKNTHSIGLCLKQCESLRTQMLRGKPITSTMVRSFEKNQSTQETLKRIAEEGI